MIPKKNKKLIFERHTAGQTNPFIIPITFQQSKPPAKTGLISEYRRLKEFFNVSTKKKHLPKQNARYKNSTSEC